MLQVKHWGLPIEGFQARSPSPIPARVRFSLSKQTCANPFSPFRLLDEENVYEKPVEVDLTTKATEDIAIVVLRVEPNVLTFGVLSNSSIVELSKSPPESDGPHFLF